MLVFFGVVLLVARFSSAFCPDNPAVDSLDVERFTGVWNVIEESDNPLAGPSRNVKCKHTVLSIPSPDSGHDIRAKMISYNLTSRAYNETRFGLKKMKTNHVDGKFEFHVNELRGIGARFFVVGTDYDNYAVVWVCYTGNTDEAGLEYNAVLSRRKSLGELYLNEAQKLIPRGSYRTVDQSFCPEYKSHQP